MQASSGAIGAPIMRAMAPQRAPSGPGGQQNMNGSMIGGPGAQRVINGPSGSGVISGGPRNAAARPNANFTRSPTEMLSGPDIRPGMIMPQRMPGGPMRGPSGPLDDHIGIRPGMPSVIGSGAMRPGMSPPLEPTGMRPAMPNVLGHAGMRPPISPPLGPAAMRLDMPSLPQTENTIPNGTPVHRMGMHPAGFTGTLSMKQASNVHPGDSQKSQQPWLDGSGGTAYNRNIGGSPVPIMPNDKAIFSVKGPNFKRRTKLYDEESDKQFAEEYTPKGGLKTFKRLVVLNNDGDLGQWTGFSWKSRRGCDIIKIAHDQDGRLWFINRNNEIGKILRNGFKIYGSLGNESVTDIAFDNSNKLWAVNRMGEIATWNGFSWDKKPQHGFHKIKAIAFDKKGSLWAINGACQVAVWDDDEQCWDQKEVPGGVRVFSLDFDEKNKLWVIGSSDELLLLSGQHWINFGWLACWKLKDISFRK